MTETYLVTKGGEKHKWNGKILGRRLVRLDCKKADGAELPLTGEFTLPITPPKTTLHLHTPTPSKLNDAGDFQWFEGLILAHKHGYDRIKVVKTKNKEPYIEHMDRPRPTGILQQIVNAFKDKERNYGN